VLNRCTRRDPVTGFFLTASTVTSFGIRERFRKRANRRYDFSNRHLQPQLLMKTIRTITIIARAATGNGASSL
jgi:hypothetical protein